MRNSIKSFLLIFAAVLFTGVLFAQRSHKDTNPEERATKMAERLTTALDLNDAQTTKIKAVYLKYGERKQAMRSQKKEGDREQMKTAMKQMRSDLDNEIKAILSAEQFKQYQEMPRPSHRKGRHGKKGGKDRKAFHNEKVKPIMLEQRAKLESKISKEDKATIAQLRVDLKQERQDRKKIKGQKRERPDKAEREKRKAERESNPNFIKLKELTEKYSAEIEPLLAEVKEEIKALKKEQKGERKKGKGAKGEKPCEDCKEGKRKGDGEHKARHKDRKYAKFLLLDPEQKQAQNERISAISEVSVYPNPSQGISQIKYQLKTDGNVLIELHDKEGNLVDTIENTRKAAGSYKTPVNLGKYTVGIYYIVLIDENGNKVSKKVIR